MSSMHLKLISSILLTLGHFTATSFGSDFEYFSKGVDFWNETTQKPQPSATKADSEKKVEKPEALKGEMADKEAFPWPTYLDPKNKEFFREGDYTPPEPFMELVRNPSDENLKMWFSYVDRKNELAGKLQERMTEYLAKHGTSVPPEQKKVTAALKVSTQPIDPRRYRLRMYFNTSCPHCQKMFLTLADLQAQGFFVEARQLDRNGQVNSKLPFPSELASPDEIAQKNIQSVPLLLIGDLKRKLVYRLSGFQPADAVLNAIRQQDGGT